MNAAVTRKQERAVRRGRSPGGALGGHSVTYRFGLDPARLKGLSLPLIGMSEPASKYSHGFVHGGNATGTFNPKYSRR